MKSSEIKAPTVSLPKGGGAIKSIGETFQPNTFNGTGSFLFPIPLTPARGLQPELSMTYNSGSGNGPFGIGFTLPLALISRKTDNGIPRYDNRDTFALSGSDLVPALVKNNSGQWVPDIRTVQEDGISWTVTVYRPDVESDFSLIEFWQDTNSGMSFWRIVTPENVEHVYGKSEHTRIADPNIPTHIFTWLIERSTDATGNKVEYRYREENDENVPPALYEENRSWRANRYIDTICYGNYVTDNGDGGTTEHYAFEVVFDYGGYDLANPDAPPSGWTARQDPFSSYRSGFEIRTFRLCRNILLFHRFPSQFENHRFLVKAVHFAYEETPAMSFLTGVEIIGYQKSSLDGQYATGAFPPVRFTYSGFEPTGKEFLPLVVQGGGKLPGYIGAEQFLPVDLYGEGIPGFLFSNDTVTLYWRPQGDAVYGYPEPPEQFPIEKDLESGLYELADIDGNGQMELVVTTPSRGGYYKNVDGVWEPYRDFLSYPLEASTPEVETVDLTGDGLADLAIFMEGAVRYYTSLGTAGYTPAVSIPESVTLPLATASTGEFVGFADMFGDGLSHRIRIRSGQVECWPNLGYGHFGPVVQLGNAPMFDGKFDPSRLFLVDVDGSGTTDLAYAYSDRIEVFLNRSGNSFAEPVSIPLPMPYNSINHITFTDVKGSGSSALVLTSVQDEVQHVYYDFTSGVKPYLLTDIDNNLGNLTRIGYASSTAFYFADKDAGRPWVTRLPFPVQVVERIESIDRISKSKLVQRFAYHDGYYDPIEREFRGFGYVETWDTQTFEDFAQPGLLQGVEFNTGQEELHAPAVYTKEWFHTGAYETSGIISRQYEQEYYHGDPDEYVMPDSSFAPDIGSGSTEEIRQAYAALYGQLIRREVYGLDDKPGLSENPYTVSESCFYVRRLQPAQGYHKAVFYLYEQEAIEYTYDRIPNDPRIGHRFTLQVDTFGNVTESCTVYYPRRAETGRRVYPEQQRIQCTASLDRFINVTEEFRRLGVLCENRMFEIEGLDLEGHPYFSFEQISRQVDNALAPYIEQETTGSQTARLLSWGREYYWNEAQDAPLPLGAVTSRALLHHVEEAVFSSELVATAFGGKVSDKMLIDDGGYTFADGYWWNRGIVQVYYTTAEQFYLPCAMENTYAPVSSTLRIKTTLAYDSTYLVVVEITEHLSAAEKNVTTALIDYITMQPWQLTDVNGNISQVGFDVLGQVAVSTAYGWVDGVRVGNTDISDYIKRPDPTFEDVLSRPEYYLQGMSDFFYYDAFMWVREARPVAAVNLVRQTYMSDLPADENGLIQETITFFDGFGREVEKKMLVESGQAIVHTESGEVVSNAVGQALLDVVDIRYAVSGRTVYNNKGKPVEQYRPYFSDTAQYEDQSDERLLSVLPPPTITFYDPLLRVLRIDTPKGFFSKNVYSPWENILYDQDDTVKESLFYREHMPSGEGITAAEKRALEQAATFYNTPVIEVLNNLGQAFLKIVNNLGEVSQNAFTEIVAGSTVTSQELWAELVVQGYLTEGGWVTSKFQPYETGFVLQLNPPFEQFTEPVLLLLKENCLTSFRKLDIEGRELEMIDPRLYYSNITEQTEYYNFRYVYDMQGTVLTTDSVDAGMRWSITNIFGNIIYAWDARGFCSKTSYDQLQRPVSIFVQGDDEQGLQLDQIVQRMVYGEGVTDSKRYNLRGEIYASYDQAGVETFPLYSIAQQVLTNQRQLRTDYKTEANWDIPADVPLDPEIFETRQAYNALGEMIQQTTPDGSIYRSTYDVAGQTQRITVEFADGSTQTFIESIDYTASSSRQLVRYGNGVTTENTFEWTTEQLLKIYTTRPQAIRQGSNSSTVLQNIDYTYDPVGNIMSIRDSSYETIFCDQQMVEPLSEYTYDALYHLIKATGRQHPGIQKDTHTYGFKQTKFMPLCPVHPNDMDKLQNYTEFYTYDDSGNLTELNHVVPPSQLSSSWTRTMPVEANSNRLAPQEGSNRIYDANGNMLDLDNLRGMQWSYNNMLARVDTIIREDGNSDSDYFVYDSSGNRVRKVSERYTNGGTITEVEEKIYLGTLEIKRQKKVSAQSAVITLERQSLHIMDENTRIAITNWWPVDIYSREVVSEPRTFRFQLDNNLGSSCVEVTQNADIISYEEYFPYGSTAVIAGESEAEVQPKDYRYSGKECDDSTGLYYYGARYYATWIGRWVSADPSGPVDGPNIYAFVNGNPITMIDSDGRGISKNNKRKQPTRTRRKPHRLIDTYKSQVYTKRVRNSTGVTKSFGGLPKDNTARAQAILGLVDKSVFETQQKTNKYLVGIYFTTVSKVYMEDMKNTLQGRSDEPQLLSHFQNLYNDSLTITPRNKTGGTEITGEFATAKYMMGQTGFSMRLGYAKGRGIDQIWKKGNEYHIVEAKGEGATLAWTNHGTQMSREWVDDRLIALHNSLDSDRSNLAKEIIKNANLDVDITNRKVKDKPPVKGVSASPIRGIVVEARWSVLGTLSGTSKWVPDKGVYHN